MVESISRRMIEESSDSYSTWIDIYHEISRTLFNTPAREENWRGEAPWEPGDFASMQLYSDLMKAHRGELEIPEYLEVDQIEDWFVARAIRKGLQIYDDSLKVSAAFSNNRQED